MHVLRGIRSSTFLRMFHFQGQLEVRPRIFLHSNRNRGQALFQQIWFLLLLHSRADIFLQWWWCWRRSQDILGRRFRSILLTNFWFVDCQPRTDASIFWNCREESCMFLQTWHISQLDRYSRFLWGLMMGWGLRCWWSFRSKLRRSREFSCLLPFEWVHHLFCFWGWV